MRIRLSLVTTASILAALLFGTAATASAATRIGQAPPPVGEPTDCLANSALVQLSVSGGADYVAPADGVITSWRSSLFGTVEFSVFRPTGGFGDFERTAADQETGTGTLTRFPARTPILAGDRIGIRPVTATTSCTFKTGEPTDVIGIGNDAPVGSTFTYSPDSLYRLNVAAVIEPDADGDGYGDESQDLCPADATQQGDCDAPETTITKRPDDVSSRPNARFRFVSSEPGSTFKCRLTGRKAREALKQFRKCTSPKVYKNLEPGRYRFAVRATDAAGNTDLTPAKDRFRIVR